MSLINTDRQANGVANVSLSTVNAAQSHAEDMFQNSYTSYWDTNGYKPHMRYTLAGGLGAVCENLASTTTSGTINPYNTIKNLEALMMLSSQKTNILYPSHNKVSIGIAYDSNNLYFVEDFENVHVAWTQLSQVNGNVTMNGILDNASLNVQGVAVYYDNPTSLTSQQLNSPTYNFNVPYDLGTLIAAALPSNNTRPGVIIPAQIWSQTGLSFQINFSLQDTFLTHGRGVYTLCLLSSLNETDTSHDSLSTYSVWYPG